MMPNAAHVAPKRNGIVSDQLSKADIEYVYKASLIGSAHRFRLSGQALHWQVGGRSGVWPLASISAVRLSYRPVSMQTRRFRADIENSSGERIAMLSTSWQTVALLEPQDRQYRAFILELHQRLHAIGSNAFLTAGVKPLPYLASQVVLALITVAMASLILRALWMGFWAGALFIAGFAVLLAWQAWGFMTRNRPRQYGADDVPGDVLPPLPPAN